MELLALMIGPPIATYVILAVLPAGAPAAMGFGIMALLIAIMAAAIFPLRPYSGPDDWFRGIEVLPLMGACIAFGMTGAAQLWRWRRIRSGQRPYYVGALVATTLFGVIVTLGLPLLTFSDRI